MSDIVVRAGEEGPGRLTVGRTALRVLLVVALAAGSLLTWTGIPVGWLWVGHAIGGSAVAVYLAALLGAPPTMVGWGWVLFRGGDAYERLSGRPASARGGRRATTLVETLLVVSAVLAVVAFVLWYFLLSGKPSGTPWPDEVSGGGG